jgi:hypothetical protein
MIGQHNECVNREDMVSPRISNRVAQDRDIIDKQMLPPIQQVDREEPASARHERTTIIRHEAEDNTSYMDGVIGSADYAFG